MGPVRPHRALATSCVTGSGHLAALGSRQGPGSGWVPGVEEKRPFLLPGLVGRSFHASGTFARAGLPDHEKLSMPALSPTMSQGNIVAWKKKEGDAVQPGDVYCEVETDKATIEWEAQEEGYLAKILMGDGTQGIDVGVPVAVLVEEEGDVAAFAGYTGDAADVAAPDGAGSVSGSDAGSGEGSEASSSSSSVFPVHEVMTMPALSPTMAEGTLVAWKKAVGDVISAGDVLAEIETDKATMEWEAQEDGVLAQILVAEGTAGVCVGAPVFVQVEDAAEVASFASFTIADASVDGSEGVDTPAVATTPGSVPSAPKTAAPAVARVSPTPASVPASSAPDGARVIASPYARKLAAANGVSLHALQGSGPNGRIVAADVLGAPASAAAATASTMSPFSDIENSNIRKIIAQRLLESKQQIPHYYLSTTCRVDTVTALRAKLNASLADGKLSMNDFIIKASAMALKKVPEANASWHGDFIRQYNTVCPNTRSCLICLICLICPICPICLICLICRPCACALPFAHHHLTITRPSRRFRCTAVLQFRPLLVSWFRSFVMPRKRAWLPSPPASRSWPPRRGREDWTRPTLPMARSPSPTWECLVCPSLLPL